MVGDASGTRPDQMRSSVAIMPYMMEADEVNVVAESLYRGLITPQPHEPEDAASGAPSSVAGDWTLSLQFSRGASEQVLRLVQDGTALSGSQIGEIYEAELKGSIHGERIQLNSTMKLGGGWIQWHFTGTVTENRASGTVNMAEYGEARWTAVRG